VDQSCRFNLRPLKKSYRKAQKIKHSTSKDGVKKATRCEEIQQAYRDYLLEAERLLEKSKTTIKTLNDPGKMLQAEQIAHDILITFRF